MGEVGDVCGRGRRRWVALGVACGDGAWQRLPSSRLGM
jgi:hypothetical protein